MFLWQYELWMNFFCTSVSFAVVIILKTNLGRYLPLLNSILHSFYLISKRVLAFTILDIFSIKIANIPPWIFHVTSTTVLLAWLELMFLIGRFPIYGYYALMFSVVLKNVIKVSNLTIKT